LFYFKGDVINVVLEVILVENVAKNKEATKKMAVKDIGKFFVERYIWLMTWLNRCQLERIEI
jgi:hypothetical protein